MAAVKERGLSPRHAAFCDAYTSPGPAFGIAAASAQAAGYIGTPGSMQTIGYRLLRHPAIAAELARRTEKASRPSIVDAAEAREMLSAMLRDPAAPRGDRIKALGSLAKMNGWFSFVHRHEGSAGGAIVHEVKVSIGDARALAKEKP